MIQDKNIQALSDKAFDKTKYSWIRSKTLWDIAFDAGYEAGYSNGHEDQMKMRIADAIENNKKQTHP